VSIYEFELSNIETVIQLFSFLETKVRQGTAEVRGDQAIFSAASDGVIYDSLITKITENQNKLEALQKIALERRQQGIDKLRRSVGRN
jgi:glycyl-tRNA synthetase alpha subunit